MINGDRLLRVIYREANMNELFLFENGIDCVDDNFVERAKLNFSRQFLLTDSNYVSKLIEKYISVYPDNYHKQDIELTIKHYAKLAEEKFPMLKNNSLSIILYFSEKLLIMQNDQIQIDFNTLLEWDGFANKIDYNVMIASFCAINSCSEHLEKTPSVPRVNNDRLYTILSGGISENHMHLFGSGYGTEINLNNFMVDKFFDEKCYEKFCKTASTSMSSMGLHEEDNKLHLVKFKLLKLLLENYQEIVNAEQDELGIRDVITMLSAQSIDDLSIWMEKLNHWQNALIDKYEKAIKDSCHNQYQIERKFLVMQIKNVFKNPNDILLLYLLNSYIAMLSKFKFEFVQDNIGKGFSKFKDKESQKDTYILKNKEDMSIVESVFDKYYKEKFVKSIEFRVTSGKLNSAYYRKLAECNEKAFQENKNIKNLKKIKFALISHYIKPSDRITLKEYQHNRIDSLKNMYKKDQNAVEMALRQLNDVEKDKVVSIDTANYETYCRPEVFGEYYRKIRKEYPKLNFTYHAGEDFSTIANGVRSVYEAVNFLGYRRGDRIGHAIALGIDVKTSARRKRNEIFTTQQEYVDDIAWLYYMISSYHKGKTEISVYLENEFKRNLVSLFNGIDIGYFSIVNYINSMMLRSDNGVMLLERFLDTKFSLKNEEDFLFNNSNSHNNAIKDMLAVNLTIQYFYNEQLNENGQAVHNELDLDERYIESVELAQQSVKKIVVDKGIAIEVNPSSNKKISSTKRFNELPLLKFNHFGLNFEDNSPNIPVSINTDDSAIFQSNLSNEYALVLAALCRDYEPESAYAYIEYLRRSSMQQCFIKDK